MSIASMWKGNSSQGALGLVSWLQKLAMVELQEGFVWLWLTKEGAEDQVNDDGTRSTCELESFRTKNFSVIDG